MAIGKQGSKASAQYGKPIMGKKQGGGNPHANTAKGMTPKGKPGNTKKLK